MCVQVIRMLLAIICVFFLCWGPKWILNVLKRHQLDILYSDKAFYMMVRACTSAKQRQCQDHSSHDSIQKFRIISLRTSSSYFLWPVLPYIITQNVQRQQLGVRL